MRLTRMNWMQVEAYLAGDDRVVLPLGSTEQHGYLSVATGAILAERVAVDAAEPLGVPVYPALPYGLAPRFMAYPGTVTLRPETYVRLLRDILDSLTESGFRRILVVNGHAGNGTARKLTRSWAFSRPGMRVRFHDWWQAPRTWSKITATDPVALHASWMENFPWTRLAGVALPEEPKEPVERGTPVAAPSPQGYRRLLGDGSYGGYYERSDVEMMQVWAAAVQELRAVLEDGWDEEPAADEPSALLEPRDLAG